MIKNLKRILKASLVAAAAIPLMGFTDAVVDWDEPEEFQSVLKSVLAPMSTAQKTEFMGALLLVGSHDKCMNYHEFQDHHGYDPYAGQSKTQSCAELHLNTEMLGAKAYLKTGRFDTNVERIVSSTLVINDWKEGHSPLHSHTLFARRYGAGFKGKTANQILAEGRKLREIGIATYEKSKAKIAKRAQERAAKGPSDKWIMNARKWRVLGAKYGQPAMFLNKAKLCERVDEMYRKQDEKDRTEFYYSSKSCGNDLMFEGKTYSIKNMPDPTADELNAIDSKMDTRLKTGFDMITFNKVNKFQKAGGGLKMSVEVTINNPEQVAYRDYNYTVVLIPKSNPQKMVYMMTTAKGSSASTIVSSSYPARARGDNRSSLAFQNATSADDFHYVAYVSSRRTQAKERTLFVPSPELGMEYLKSLPEYQKKLAQCSPELVAIQRYFRSGNGGGV